MLRILAAALVTVPLAAVRLIGSVLLPLLCARAMVLSAGLAWAVGLLGIRVSSVTAPSAIRGAVMLVALAAAIITCAVSYGLWRADENASRFLEAHERTRAPSLEDRQGRWIGLYPTLDRASDDPSLVSMVQHTTLAVEEVPHLYWSCLTWLEDRRFGTWVAAAGVDPIAMTRAAVAVATGRVQGGSGLAQMLSSSMRGMRRSADEPIYQRLGRKLIELVDAPAITALMRAPDGVAPEVFVATNLPHMVGAKDSFAGDLPLGVEALARVVWQRPAHAMSPAMQLIAASAIWKPVLLAPRGDKRASLAAAKRWEQLKERAARCLHLAGDPGSRVHEVVRAELSKLHPPVVGDDDPLLAREPSADKRFRVAVNPTRRSLQTLGSAALQTIQIELASLEDAAGVSRIGLTIDALLQTRFRQAVEQALTHVASAQISKLSLQLTGPDAAPNRAQVLAVVSDLNGQILAFYEAGPPAFDDDGRHMASLGKMIAAVTLSQWDTATTPYCGQPVRSEKGRYAKCVEAQTVTARAAFARSLNWPIINRLSRINPSELVRVASAFGLELPIGIPPATALTLGLYETSPRRILQIVATLGQAVGMGSAQTALPRLVNAIDGHPVEAAQGAIDAAAISLSPSAKRFLLDVLSEPLRSGTLKGLARFHPSNNPAIRRHIAKTGTSQTPTKGTRDAMIAGALELSDGRTYAYLVLAGAPDVRRPLGSINGGHLARVAAAVIDTIMKGDQP